MAYMRQQGLGSYSPVGDWSWLYYPPPYDFLAPADSVALPAPVLFTPGGNGLGCACGGSDRCGCRPGGLGLFDSGLDLNQWGVAEWGVVAGGAYLAMKLLGDVFAVRQTVRRHGRKRAAAKRARLERQLEALA